MLKKNIKYLFSILLIFNFHVIFSQEKQGDSLNLNLLNEVIITGTKTKRILSSLPLNSSLVKKEDIEKTNASRLSDVINEELGLITVSDFGGGEGIQMQGLDSQYTLILIDNQPIIGRSAGTLDLDRISVGNIKQVEIVRGASSSLYGNEALAGVINIITDEPKKGFNVSLSSSYETHNTLDNNISLSYSNKNFNSSFFLNNYSSDGYDLNQNDELNTVNKFRNSTLQLKLKYEINKSFDIKLNSRYFAQSIDNVASNSLTGESFTKEDNINLSISHKSKKIITDLDVYFTSFYGDEYLDDDNGERFSESFYDQILFKPEIKSVYSLDKMDNIVLGFGLKHESLNRTYFDINPKQNSPFAYFQYDYHPNEKINLIFGGRFDKFEEYKSQISPKFSGIYRIDDSNSLKFSLGYGFKAPDFRQLYFNFSNTSVGYSVIGYNVINDVINQLIEEGQIANIIIPISDFNTPLKPESSLSINIGYDRIFNDNISIKSNLFVNSTKNLIDYRVIANKTNGQNVFSYYNINNVSTYGLEVETKFKADNNFDILFGYQLLYAFDIDARRLFENGEVYARENPSSPAFRLKKSDYFGLYNRSRHMGVLKINYTNPKRNFSSNLRLKYRSRYGLYDSNSNNYLDIYDEFVKGYLTANFSFNKNLKTNFIISTGIENILNYKDPNNIQNLSGRILYLKLKYRIN